MLLLELKRKRGTLDTIHFVGIGGIGMSGIAEIMYNLGYKVQGSDLSESHNTKRLQEKGIRVIIGHEKQNVSNVSYVVISSAVKSDNPEVVAAIETILVKIEFTDPEVSYEIISPSFKIPAKVSPLFFVIVAIPVGE